MQNWKDSDWKRWRVDCVYKHFKKRDGARCRSTFSDGGGLISLGGSISGSFHGDTTTTTTTIVLFACVPTVFVIKLTIIIIIKSGVFEKTF